MGYLQMECETGDDRSVHLQGVFRSFLYRANVPPNEVLNGDYLTQCWAPSTQARNVTAFISSSSIGKVRMGLLCNLRQAT